MRHVSLRGTTVLSVVLPLPSTLAVAVRPSYTQELWMRVKGRAAYLPGC